VYSFANESANNNCPFPSGYPAGGESNTVFLGNFISLMTDSQQHQQEDLVNLLCSNLTAPIDDKRYFGSQQGRLVDQDPNTADGDTNGYLSTLNYPYYPPGSRDSEWQEYVALMKFPGHEPPQHQQNNGIRDTSEGNNYNHQAATPSDESYGHNNATEADFVQSFAVHGQGSNFMEYQAGYLQGFPHPFNPQLYSHITDSRLFAPVYSFQYPIALHPTPEMGYYPTGDNFQIQQQELLDSGHLSQPLVQHSPLYPSGQMVLNGPGTGLEDGLYNNAPPPQNGNHQPQQGYVVTSGMAALSLQDEQPQAKPKPKSDGRRTWADVLTAPKPPQQSQSQLQTASASSLSAGYSKTKGATKSSPSPAPQLPLTTTSQQPQQQSTQPTISNKPKSAPGDEKQPRRADKPKDSKQGPEKAPMANDVVNPREFDTSPRSARFFVIKSYSEDDIHKAIKYNIWASTDSGNRRLDAAFRESGGQGPIYLLFSVNASGQFCGMAQMISAIDYTKKSDLWAQDKWNGQFFVKWIFIKDIPNNQFRHIRLENNDNKPVTNSRDTQEVMLEQGKEILRIFLHYNSKTSILDDFGFYDKRQEMKEKKATDPVNTIAAPSPTPSLSLSPSPSPSSSPSSPVPTNASTGKGKFHRGNKPNNK